MSLPRKVLTAKDREPGVLPCPICGKPVEKGDWFVLISQAVETVGTGTPFQSVPQDGRYVAQKPVHVSCLAAPPKPEIDTDDLIEVLAASEHDRWSRWHKHLRKLMHEPGRMERWDRLAETPYAELDEPTKELDRIEARRTLEIVRDIPVKKGAIYPPWRGNTGHPCEECGQDDKGSTRDDRGFMRCNVCGHPGQ